MRKILLLSMVSCLIALVAGCSGSAKETFEDGFYSKKNKFGFDQPEGWELLDHQTGLGGENVLFMSPDKDAAGAYLHPASMLVTVIKLPTEMTVDQFYEMSIPPVVKQNKAKMINKGRTEIEGFDTIWCTIRSPEKDGYEQIMKVYIFMTQNKKFYSFIFTSTNDKFVENEEIFQEAVDSIYFI